MTKPAASACECGQDVTFQHKCDGFTLTDLENMTDAEIKALPWATVRKLLRREVVTAPTAVGPDEDAGACCDASWESHANGAQGHNFTPASPAPPDGVSGGNLEMNKYMPIDAELLPCPFCGGEAALTNVRMSNHTYRISCTNELCFRPSTDYIGCREQPANKQDVIDLWNNRRPAADAPARADVPGNGAVETLAKHIQDEFLDGYYASYCKTYNIEPDYGPIVMALRTGWNAALAHARERQTDRWRDVKDGYPAFGALVVTCRDTGERLIYEAETWSEEAQRYAAMNNIIRWMPLQPYQQRPGQREEVENETE